MIRRILIPVLAALAGLLPAAPAQAYWDYGHETVAAIAYRNVTPQTRAAIDRMIARADLLQTSKCPVRTVADASTWPDCIKSYGPRFSYTSNWHYQNVNVCKPFDLKEACKDGNCVSAQIERDVKILKDAGIPLTERIQALSFLIHFVGDLHMPLHAGDRGDLGGNRVRAAYGLYAPERFNLHSLWDGWLTERAISTPPSLIRFYSPEERDPIAAGTVEDWSRQSWEVARDVTYATALGGDPCGPVPPRAMLTDATIAGLIPTVRLNVERGGLRLARLLDESLGR
jgi:hypothetical protein